MKNWLAVLLSLSCWAWAWGEGWLLDWEQARQLSQSSRRPVMMEFTGSDWCGWCTRLREEVLDTPRFKEWANTRVILLEVDLPMFTRQEEPRRRQNEALAKKFQVDTFPTVIFLDDKGQEIGRLEYLEGGPEPWVKAAEKILQRSQPVRTQGADS